MVEPGDIAVEREVGVVETPAPVRAPNAVPRVRTLLVCDLADSTALVERLGDAAAAELLRRHDRLARSLMQRHAGREIDKTDGFLVLFERPVEAVSFALAYQRELRRLSEETGQTLRARIGVHMGEVVLWENAAADIAEGAKPLDVEGLAKPVAARLMALALPGQILLSGVAFTLAQRAERDVQSQAPVRWLTHGRYRFKGVPAPMLVHEAGEAGFAPLAPPPSSGKAEREVPLWRRPSVLTLEALALIAAIAVPVALTFRAPPAIAFGERDWVVVGDLRNLTGEPTLDDSLETAFRISLEQSRYVNVLPDLKLRDTLARMQRPGDTTVDRTVASEIALREGARAVILPTVAEIGGRVRVSAEVIDPNTQTTVYAESADGVGATSALESIDEVTHELRSRLGEALAAIEQDSQPLPRITSGSLDALRAYALANTEHLSGRYKSALALYQQALAADPDFALAHIGIGRVYMGAQDEPRAAEHFRRGAALRDRLTTRDALYVDAWMASLAYAPDEFDKWGALVQVYPDFHGGHFNRALFAWQHLNQFEAALENARAATARQNPQAAPATYMLGILQLGAGSIDDALVSFEQARKLGLRSAGYHAVGALLAAGRLDQARSQIDERRETTGLASEDVFDAIEPMAVALTRGDTTAALAAIDAAQRSAGEAGHTPLVAFRSLRTQLTVLAATDEDAAKTALRRQMEAIAADTAAAEHVDVGEMLILAYLAARHGDAALARVARERADKLLETLHYPALQRLARLAEAQALLAADPAAALAKLDASHEGGELYLERLLRLEAYQAMGDETRAARARRDLAAHRGQAFAEWVCYWLVQPLDIDAARRVQEHERAGS
jgi:putative peptide modification system cyclase